MNDKIIYLDHAAATPLDPRVLAAMQPYFAENFYNPSSPYAPAVMVRRQYEDAKHRIAVALGVQADEIVMTAGATESINIMFRSVSGHIVTTSIEHPAVLESAKSANATIIPVSEKGMVDLDVLRDSIHDETELVSVGLANNELGTIQNLRAIAEIIKQVRRARSESGNKTPIIFHTDASQGAGQIDISPARLGVDAMTLNAGKMYGPKQVGLLWVTREMPLAPYVYGGGQERGIRSGTENVAGVVGFAEALTLAVEHRKSESDRLSRLRDMMHRSLAETFPDAVFAGSQKRRLPGHLHVAFPNVDAERLVFVLENMGVLVATGSACAANKGTRSHVLEAIGLAPEVADGSLRITLGRLNDEDSIQIATQRIIEAVASEKKRSGK